MKGGAKGGDTNKAPTSEIDITGTVNGTTYIKQITIVYTGKDGKRMKERFVACGVKGMK